MELTIDELAGRAGTTTRSIRSFQTMGLLPRPDLRGRTGVYGARHLEGLRSIRRLQAQGFSLQSLAVLFGAQARGESLASVLGLTGDAAAHTAQREPDRAELADTAELYGFADLQSTTMSGRRSPQSRRRLLSVVPTTMWDQTEAS
jgi:DNA-binding transcriptional MerR regulator